MLAHHTSSISVILAGSIVRMQFDRPISKVIRYENSRVHISPYGISGNKRSRSKPDRSKPDRQWYAIMTLRYIMLDLMIVTGASGIVAP